MVMGERGMADMTGDGNAHSRQHHPDDDDQGRPFGSVEMGGMFSVLKVRHDQKPGDYKNPGWYKTRRHGGV